MLWWLCLAALLASPVDASTLHPGASAYHRRRGARRSVKQRCVLAKPGWCGLYYQQQVLSTKPAPTYGVPCPGGCNGIGNCDAMLGVCDCPAGWTGNDCKQVQKRPCGWEVGGYKGPGTEPSSFIDEDGRDKDWTVGVDFPGRCPGICDDTIAACYCDSESKYGRINAPKGSPPGTPPVKRGRTIGDWCRPNTTADGRPTWGQFSNIAYNDMYGPDGWCNADPGQKPRSTCGCILDGEEGLLCDEVVEMTCPNQCSGHGTCDLGWCKCDQGWFGLDCANRVTGNKDSGVVDLDARPWLKKHLVPVPAVSATSQGTRQRPFIYLYDVPAIYVGKMWQYRVAKGLCPWRLFGRDNATVFTHWLYSVEPLFHELLLQSPHRTLDPEEADLFYVPAYAACLFDPVVTWADFPRWYSDGPLRVSHAAKMMLELKRHLQKTYPYWDRKQGRDHIWLFAHDEGACWAPSEIYTTSIILTSWGRMDLNHTSNTAFYPDNYTMDHPDVGDKLNPKGWTHLHAGHPCYNPDKDLVLPSLKVPSQYPWSPLLGAPLQPKKHLLFFRGDVGKVRHPNYSRGIRQRVYNLTVTRGWTLKYNISIGDSGDIPGDYSQHLASSTFCLCMPGDGFSARAEDAILHGCIPVVIMDQVHQPLQSIMAWGRFSVRIPEAHIEQLPQILLNIPQRRVKLMAARVRRVMHRFAFLSHPLLQQEAQVLRSRWQAEKKGQAGANGTSGDQGGEDWLEELVDEDYIEEVQEAAGHGGLGIYGQRARGGKGTSGYVSSVEAKGEARLVAQFNVVKLEDDAFNTIIQWLYARMLSIQKAQPRTQ